MKFPYKKIPVIDPKTQEVSHVFRPIIPVTLSFKGNSVSYEVLIDSGADECVFDTEIAKILRLPLNEEKEKSFGGISGGEIKAYRQGVEVGVDGISFVTEVYFSPDLSRMGYGILGQKGFFDHFRVRFIYSKKVVEITKETRS